MSAQFLLHPPPLSPNLRQTKGKSKGGGGGGKDNWGLVHIWPNKFETEHDFLSTVILNNYTCVNPKRAFQALSGRHYSLYFFQNVRAKESRRWSLRF